MVVYSSFLFTCLRWSVLQWRCQMCVVWLHHFCTDVSRRPYRVRQILTFHIFARVSWALLPQQMVLHCSFSCAFSRLHVRLVCYPSLCVCCRIFVIYICETHICALFLSASCLQAALDLAGKKKMWIYFIFNIYLFIPRRCSSTAVFLCVRVHILFWFAHSFLCIAFITQHAREPWTHMLYVGFT